MGNKGTDKEWVYVIIAEQGGHSSIFGLHDQEKGIDFIPTFLSKDDANDCFLSLPKEKGKKYEVQAIHTDELYADANENGFTVAFIDGDGKIIKDL